LKGILTFSLEQESWTVQRIHPEFLRNPMAKSPEGIIAFLPRREDHVALPPVPIINISSHSTDHPVCSVLPDNVNIGELAATHLLEKGYRNFMYSGNQAASYSRDRAEGFFRVLRMNGYAKRVITSKPEQEQEAIRACTPPTGVFCATDARAARIAEGCRAHGYLIPQDIGIIGCDNDPLAALSCGFPLSSIDPAGEEVGWQAGRLLDQTLRGEAAPQLTRIAPVGVLSRESTDLLAMSDSLVVQVLQLMKKHATEPGSLSGLLTGVPASRSLVEKRFKEATGMTLLQYRKRLRLDHACALLKDGTLSVGEIMDRAGYTCRTRFHKEFRRYQGKTPLEYRRSR